MKYSPAKTLLVPCLCAALFAVRALPSLAADSPPPAPPDSEQARSYLQLGYVLNSCYSPINVSAQNMTLEGIAERVHKAMLALNSPSNQAPSIEIREANPIRLNFGVKGTTPIRVLTSAGQLANVQLWVFPDHILLAPESALTAAEVESTKKKLGLKLELKDFLNPATFAVESRVSMMAFIAADIKPDENPAGTAKEVTTPKAPSQTQEKVALGDLPQESQAMLRLLLDTHNASTAQLTREYSQESPWMPFSTTPDFVTSKDSTVTVENRPMNGADHMALVISSVQSGTLAFSLDGRVVERMLPPSAPPQTPPVAPPLLDPSAHKS